MPLRGGGALAGGFVEEDGGGDGGVEGVNARGERDAEASVAGAFDFGWKAGAFVADEDCKRGAEIGGGGRCAFGN